MPTRNPRPRARSCSTCGWPGHRAGHHVDVRLSAEDGCQASRSYSIASAPEDDAVELTIERLGDGEVSSYLVDHVIGGGSGMVPLMAMLRAAGPVDDAAKAAARAFVCGPTAFVGTVTRLLVDQGCHPRAIRAEEFGSAGENSTQGGAG